jgi:hypothetical protein
LVFSNHVNKFDPEADVDGVRSKSRKAYRKELKSKRQKTGDPSSGDF